MTVQIGDIEFDNLEYDAGGDVLYLHVGAPSDATDFAETPEGHHIRLDSEGRIVGLTLVRPKQLLETEGELRVTLPVSERVDVDQLRPVLG